MNVRAGSFASYIRHPLGRVLSYSVSEDPSVLLTDTNTERQQNNEPTLVLSTQLSAAATTKAQDMAKRDYWSHNTPDGTPPWSFVTATGYSYQVLGENLAAGFDNEQAAVNAWMASPPHRENLLDPSYTEVGFGFANDPNYKAAGGGPMTIIVAFYGTPFGSGVQTASAPQASSGGNQAPSTKNSSGKLLASETSRGQLAIGKSSVSGWLPAGLAIGLAAVLGIFIGRHLKNIRRAIARGERYVWHHPLFDLCLLLIAGLAFVLMQTAGYIQ